MKYLGIDYGTKRIGVAVSDDTGTLAFPLAVVVARENAVSEVCALAKERGAEKIVLGESKDFSGKENPVMHDVKKFAAELSERGLAVTYEPEFMTSVAAARQFAPTGNRKANPSQENLDASAAALILQSFLDRQKQGK